MLQDDAGAHPRRRIVCRNHSSDRSVNSPDTVVFFQVPEVRRILKDLAFWDVYHEHCSYFSKGSLARLFRSQGFDVARLWTDYDDQYLMIEARPSTDTPTGPLPDEEDVHTLQLEVEDFARRIGPRLDHWRGLLNLLHSEGKRVVLWGGGSKARCVPDDARDAGAG